MHRCEICGESFLNSDEFTAHITKHAIDQGREYMAFVKELQGKGELSTFPQFIDTVANHVASIILERMPTPGQELRVCQPETNFAALQFTGMALHGKKSPREVWAIYEAFLKLINGGKI